MQLADTSCFKLKTTQYHHHVPPQIHLRFTLLQSDTMFMFAAVTMVNRGLAKSG